MHQENAPTRTDGSGFLPAECAWCGGWLTGKPPDDWSGQVSHGMCGDCAGWMWGLTKSIGLLDGEVDELLRGVHERFRPGDLEALEAELRLRAGVLGWTGDPLLQPARTVLACALAVLARRDPCA